MADRAERAVLVAGGAGFIGSHLCERLLNDGCRVVCVDNFVTGAPDNVRHLAGPMFTLIDHDITEPLELDDAIDEVYQFASPASPADFERMPLAILRVGAFGTHHCLELALSKGARFMLASTSEVYGDAQVHPQHEGYYGNVNSIGVRSAYDEAKRFGEALTMAYHREHGLQTRIVRIFNTYGPRMRPDDGRMIPNFITQALAGVPLTIYGDGAQTRSVQYVTDLIEGVVRLMRSDETLPVNIGNPDEYSVLEVAQLILQLTDSSSSLETAPLPEDDPRQRRPDITRARERLGWEPTVPAAEGLRHTIEWFAGVAAGGAAR